MRVAPAKPVEQRVDEGAVAQPVQPALDGPVPLRMRARAEREFANRVAEMTWVLFSSYRFHWTPVQTGISLAAVGVMFVIGQGVMPRFMIPRLGERRSFFIGLSVSVVLLILYGTVTQGWMIYPVMAFGIFGWTVAAPEIRLAALTLPATSLVRRQAPGHMRGPVRCGRPGHAGRAGPSARAAPERLFPERLSPARSRPGYGRRRRRGSTGPPRVGTARSRRVSRLAARPGSPRRTWPASIRRRR